MASLLYRLGRFSAHRAWLVIVAWVVILGLAGGAFALFGGTLTSAVSIPGTATQKVSDELAEKFPAASGGRGSVVFTTTDDTAFTAEQKTAIGELLADTVELDNVTSSTNPFDTQAQIDGQAQQIIDGRQQIVDGTTQIDAGQAQIDAATAQLAAGQAQLDVARSQAEAAGQLAAAQPALDEQQGQLDAGAAAIAEQQATLDAGRTALETQSTTLEQGSDLLDLAAGIRQVSDDETTAVASLQFDTSLNQVPAESKEAVVEEMENAQIDGVVAEVSNEIAASIPEILGPGEIGGVIIAAVVLFVMLGTLIGAGLPLVNALIGVGVGVLASLALSGSVEMLSVTPVLGVMLGLAVGIDYSLFILNRHRTQLRRGVELQESIGLANGTSGNAVVFAGATVLIALLALNLTGIPFLGLMGTVGAVCVFVAILVAITLTPALLGLVGEKILTKKARAHIGTPSAKVSAPIKPMNTLRAVVTVIAGIAVLLIVAIPALSMRLGLPAGSSEPLDSSAYRAYKLVDDKFGAGVNGPLLVVADLETAITDDELIAEQVRIGTALKAENDVVAVAPIGASDDDLLLAFQVIPADGPNSESTEQLVRDLRGLDIDGVSSLGVAGNASGNIDVSEKLADALPLYLLVVVGLSLIILIFVFRSILVPITATLGFVLSLFASFGAITAVFQWGWLGALFGIHDPGPILSFLPILVVGVLFGLAMDYQLFLVSGMREAYAHGAPARMAVQRGFHAGRTVVIAAALIMASVFSGFVFSNSVMIQSIGFGLAIGVLLDAFVVRLLIIPAVMHLLGDAAWWLPKWLDRILPNVDVEGASLERTHPVHPADEPELVTTPRV
ncbi:RND transporter [Cryobacterium sp. LW097]|uniref:MMPL family transporter n=1 Tax=unclassified Cryobacterium TaxID=2649013 RepID=UPI000B4C9650|nr:MULTISPECIES: MMPL family transporter [unclassified Cryobacterium]ASD20782.1 RND transporter [Cryobacterium sp. LW097]TFC50528.1 MMPL family transporter [Cryobacterium sp. TMB3-1-2]TFC74142.1 MMPL family transporter [Cryobacterium sp. TMB3-10]TFC74746.1 MMPL family transporter [Cryobacterium sp. TMB3-15]TFD40988.1 MMPL family transporter [Cryobacterium sp. TMB3-12]